MAPIRGEWLVCNLYYERVGLLPEPERRNGHRRYSEETLRRLAVIDVAKRAGFTLDDARTLLATGDDGTPAHEQIRALAQRKLPEVEVLIARAEAMKRWLTAASACRCQTLDVCRLFDEHHPGEPVGALPEGRRLPHANLSDDLRCSTVLHLPSCRRDIHAR